jgi:hypothetical protein
MPDNASAQQRGATKESRLDRAVDILKPQPGAPAKPAAPPVDQSAWRGSVEQTHVVPGLTVRDVGLSVFGETRSLRDRPGSNESIGVARQKIAHAIINDAELSHRTGKPRNKVHDPVQPSDKVLLNPDERAAYESSLRAAREAYLNGHDPTQGATHFNMRPAPRRTPFEGAFPISTQSGPYDNSFPSKNAPRHTTWLNTYLPDENEKKQHGKR